MEKHLNAFFPYDQEIKTVIVGWMFLGISRIMRDETGHHLSVISSESVQIFTDRIFRIALLLVKESEQ